MRSSGEASMGINRKPWIHTGTDNNLHEYDNVERIQRRIGDVDTDESGK
jgi:hypothetical protein